MVPPDEEWCEKRIDLSYRIGEFPLGVFSFQGQVREAHFTQLNLEPAVPACPLPEFPPNVDVLKVPSCPVARRLPRWTILPNALLYVPHQYRRFYVAIEESFAQYLNKFSSKSRSTLRRKVRKFAEFAGGTSVPWREYGTPGEIEEFYRLARLVSAKTYQEKLLGSGLPSSPDYLRYLQDLATKNSVRGYLLFHQDEPVSYLCCTARGSSLLYDYVGYDPAYSEWSPGTVLLYSVLEHLFREGRWEMFDFTEVEAEQKEFFANRHQQCADLYFFRRRVRHSLAVGLHTSLYAASRALATVANSLGVKRRLKKFFRTRS